MRSEPTRALAPVLRRPWWSRVSAGTVFMVVAGILAFLTNLVIVRSNDATVLVAVAAADLAPGTSFDPSEHARLVAIDAESELAGTLVGGGAVADLAGAIVARPFAAGEPLVVAGLVDASAPLGTRAMSIPVDPEKAAGGAIGPGDRVDVIAAGDGVARYVLTGAEVLAVPGGAGADGVRTSRFHVVVAVDADEALAVAGALDGGSIHVIRSTGAAEPTPLAPDTDSVEG